MRAYLRTRFPWLTVPMDCTWPGLIGVSKDFVPITDRGSPCPSVGYVAASAGLPWAAALGRRMAALILGEAGPAPALGPARDYPLPGVLAWIVGKPGVFALSHAWVKHH
jgi:glycine/D-amino acid oxidase-like deaminating enzyme